MTSERRPIRSAAERREDGDGEAGLSEGPLQASGVTGGGLDGGSVGPAGRRKRKPRPDLSAARSRLNCQVSSSVRHALECAKWEFNMSISDIVEEAAVEYLERRGIALAPVASDAPAPASRVR